MKTSRFTKLAVLAAGLLAANTGLAFIAGPYTVDPYTLHLWHLDETAVPCKDSVTVSNLNLSGLVNGAQLTNAAYPGFGTCMNTLGIYSNNVWMSNSAAASSFAGAGLFSNATVSAAIPMIYEGANGAFTMEALICPFFPVLTNFGSVANGGTGRAVTSWQLVSGESGTAADRIWQWRFDPIGTVAITTAISNMIPSFTGFTVNPVPVLDFINVGAGGTTYEVYAPVPTNGPNAIVSNQWFHVAVTYNGVPNTASNLNMYWTAMNPTNTSANLIGSPTLTTSLAQGTANKPSFSIGNSGRSDNGNWLGLIDEVRMSSVARGPAGMMFALPSVSLTPIPNQFVAVGSTVSLTSLASGGTPIGYQWQFNNTNITGATAANIWGFTNSTLVISNITFAQAGVYTLIATNANSAATNFATVSVGQPLPGLANTGVGTSGALLAGGAVDPHWQLVQSADSTYTGPATYVDSTIPGTYIPDGPNSQWIAPGNNVSVAGGNYLYQTSFILDSQNLTNMQLIVNWAADNVCVDILLNGVDLGITDNNGFTGFTPTIITTNFVAGTNLLVCVVSNAGTAASLSGFRAELSGLSALLPPTPPALLSAPANTSDYQYQTAAFAVTAYGSGPLSYQWFFGTNLLAGQTNRTLLLANLDPTQSGNYTVVITNSVSSTNATATLTVVTPDTLEWQGLTADWDTTSTNWFDLAAQTAVAFSQNAGVLFDDNITNQVYQISLDLPLTPNSIVVASSNTYTFGGGGYLTGNFNLLKNGAGTLILDTANTYSGNTMVQGGTLQVGNNDSSGSLGTSLITNNATLAFSRGDNALNVSSPIHGSGTVTYNGSGTVTVSGASDYTGGTIINAGILNLQNSAGLGAAGGGAAVANGGQLYIAANVNVPQALTLNGVGDGNGALRKGGAGATVYGGPVTLASDSSIGVDGSSTLNLSNVVSGATSALTVSGSGTLVLSGVSNSWGGMTTINSGSILQVGDGGADGSLGTNAIEDDGTLTFLTASSFVFSNAVTGGGVFNQSGTGQTILSGGPLTGLTGAVRINGNGVLQLAPGEALTNQASLTIGSAQADTNRLELTGGNLVSIPITIFPRAFIDTLTATTPTVNYPNIVNLSGTNMVNSSSPVTIPSGGNLFTLESDSGFMIFSNGVNAAGNGRYFALQGAAAGEVDGPITQTTGYSVNVYKFGAGTWFLNSISTYTGTTIVSNGTLVVNGVINSSPVTAAGGTFGGIGTLTGPLIINSGAKLAPTLAAGPATPIGTLTVNSNLTLMPGSSTVFQINQAAGTNDQIIGVTSVNYGGTLAVTNLAGTLAAGNSFQLFSAANYTNNFASVSGSPGSGLAWKFNPTNGVLSVVTGVNTNPTNITAVVSGGNLALSWPSDHTGWRLLLQTNHLAQGISTNTNDWTTVSGSAGTNQVNLTIDPTKPTEFYRLVYP